jgi:hypothetical protein
MLFIRIYIGNRKQNADRHPPMVLISADFEEIPGAGPHFVIRLKERNTRNFSAKPFERTKLIDENKG